MKSKLHPNCSPACPGHKNHPQPRRYVEPTVEDWQEWADRLWERYSGNSVAQEAIPVEHLSPAHRNPAGQGEVAENQEEVAETQEEVAMNQEEEIATNQEEVEVVMNQEEEAATNQEEVEVGMNQEEEAVVNQEEVAAYQEWEGGDENVAGPSELRVSFSTVHRVLVDRSTSPARLPPRIRTILSNPESAYIIETPWVNPTHFSGTAFFTDPVTVAFVEDPSRRTNKTNAQRHDSWMCSHLNISDAWHEHFIRNFPKLAFTVNKERIWWEWVSYDPFALINPHTHKIGNLTARCCARFGRKDRPRLLRQAYTVGRLQAGPSGWRRSDVG